MQYGIFDYVRREKRLTELGDQLERLNKVIPWEKFRPTLENAVKRESRHPKGGRPAYDCILMFKILILQAIYNLSDDQIEYQINDRISFMRFLELGLGDRIPDAKTIWLFRKNLTENKADEKLFADFNEYLEQENMFVKQGSIIDATFVEVPRQHNTPEEKEDIKNGKTPEEWEKPENAHKLSQKDMDARFAKKRDEYHFGYKNHILVDAGSKLIRRSAFTAANVPDSQPFPQLVENSEGCIWGDSAYSQKPCLEAIPENCTAYILERNTRGNKLTEAQRKANREKSRIRVRVEHVFGHIVTAMNGFFQHCIGFAAVKMKIMLVNLAYNMERYEFLVRA